MKYLILIDSHDKGKNPENRIGDYHQDVLTKMKEIVTIANNENVDTIIHGGDLFDTPIISTTVSDDMVDILESFKGEVKIIPGNHDEIGKNWELSKASILAHIFRRSEKIKKFDFELTDDSLVQGFEYYYDIEDDIKTEGLMSIKKDENFKVAIVHALITPKRLMHKAIHIAIEDIKSDFDIVIVAHNHSQHGIIKKDKTTYIFPGCIGRRKIDEIDVKPSVILLDTETKDFKLIQLKNVRPKEECFDLVKVAEKKEFEKEIDNFIDSLDDIKYKELNLKDIIVEIGKEKNIEQEVINEIIGRI